MITPQQQELTATLTAMDMDSFMITMVNSAISRGTGQPMAVLYSLSNLIGALSVALSTSERAVAAEHFRDLADSLEPFQSLKH